MSRPPGWSARTNRVDFTEASRTLLDMRSYADSTVATLTTYYYRARAYSGAGTSGYTSTISVSTPDCPSTAAACSDQCWRSGR